MTNYKSLTTSNKVATLKLEGDYTEARNIDTVKAEALAVLVGGYNVYGRSVDLEKYYDIKKRFDLLVSEMATELVKSK